MGPVLPNAVPAAGDRTLLFSIAPENATAVDVGGDLGPDRQAEEHFKKDVFRAIGMSGHALKHIAAAVATYWLVVLFVRKHGRSTFELIMIVIISISTPLLLLSQAVSISCNIIFHVVK